MAKIRAGYAQGGMVRGPGHGTSDSIEAEVPEGSFIMPADSTRAIGPGRLDGLIAHAQQQVPEGVAGRGSRAGVPVALSNGEFQITPEQVYGIGLLALQQMLDDTHTPIGGRQAAPPSGQRLQLADGGMVSEEDRLRQQPSHLPKGIQRQGNSYSDAPKAPGGPVAQEGTPLLDAAKRVPSWEGRRSFPATHSGKMDSWSAQGDAAGQSLSAPKRPEIAEGGLLGRGPALEHTVGSARGGQNLSATSRRIADEMLVGPASSPREAGRQHQLLVEGRAAEMNERSDAVGPQLAAEARAAAGQRMQRSVYRSYVEPPPAPDFGQQALREYEQKNPSVFLGDVGPTVVPPASPKPAPAPIQPTVPSGTQTLPPPGLLDVAAAANAQAPGASRPSGPAAGGALAANSVTQPVGKEVAPGIYQHGRGQYSDNPNGMGLPANLGKPSAQNIAALDTLGRRIMPGYKGQWVAADEPQPQQSQQQPAAGQVWRDHLAALRQQRQAGGDSGLGLVAQARASDPRRDQRDGTNTGLIDYARQAGPIALRGGVAPSSAASPAARREQAIDWQQAMRDAYLGAMEFQSLGPRAVSRAYQANLQAMGLLDEHRSKERMSRSDNQTKLEGERISGEMGLLDRAMQEAGQNRRQDVAGQLESRELDLKAAESQYGNAVKGAEAMRKQRELDILARYDAARTDEERQTLMQRYPDVFSRGGSGNGQGGRVQMMHADDGSLVAYNQDTGQAYRIDPQSLPYLGQGQQGQSGLREVGRADDGRTVYQSPDGNHFVRG
ncbi:hypothetical protein EII18_03065 [Comamonadaceae bacterium OH3737_COT-264]|nr:hypothetical protein EII18_03065 [Comamonadaceae bacterium OH3737_COT-264]